MAALPLRQERIADVSLLIRDSLKSFNRLKCTLDDIGSDIRPFFERNPGTNIASFIENNYLTVLKHHNIEYKQDIELGQDNFQPHINAIKNRNEHYLELLIEYLNNYYFTDNIKLINKESKYTLYDDILCIKKGKHSCMDSLAQLFTERNYKPFDFQIINENPDIFLQFDATVDNDHTSQTLLKDKEWRIFKSYFSSKYSEYVCFPSNKNDYLSLSATNSSITDLKNRKYDDKNLEKHFNDEFNKLISINRDDVISPLKRSHLDINVKNTHKIFSTEENNTVECSMVNMTVLECFYMEQIILYNNAMRKYKSNFFVLDNKGNKVLPQMLSQDHHHSLLEKVFINDNDILPYALFVALNMENNVRSEMMFIDNWLLLGRQLIALRSISKDDLIKVRESDNFQNIIVETSWDYLCLKEKYRIMVCTHRKYSLDNTVDMIYNYYTNNSIFDRGDCNDIKETIIWKCIFSSLRCGDLKAAAIFSESLHLENVVFSQYISAFSSGDTQTLKELREPLVELYSFEDDSKLTIKRLVLSLLLNLDDIDAKKYFQHFNDFLWFKFSKVYFFKQTKLTTIQNDIATIIHTNVSSNSSSDYYIQHDPLAIAQALLYTADYIGCLCYLSSFASLKSHLVNLAIAMHKEHAILINNNSEFSFKIYQNMPTNSKINIKDIIFHYISDLAIVNIDFAVEYIYLFKDINNDLVVSLMVNISKVSKSLSRLYGNVLSDGSHTNCLVNQFGDNLSEKILRHVARFFEKNNNLYNAIRIYDISKNHRKVVKLINVIICESICLSYGNHKHQKIFDTSNFLFNRMIEENWNIKNDQRIFFEFLHDFLWLDQTIKNNDIISALEVANNSRFVPTNSESMYDFQNLINNLPPLAFRFFGNFITMTTRLFYDQYISTLNSASKFQFKNQDIPYIKNKMNNFVKIVTQMCDNSIISTDAMQAILLIDNKLKC